MNLFNFGQAGMNWEKDTRTFSDETYFKPILAYKSAGKIKCRQKRKNILNE